MKRLRRWFAAVREWFVVGGAAGRTPRRKSPPRELLHPASRKHYETLADYTRRVEANRLIAMGRLSEATKHLRREQSAERSEAP